MLIPFGRKWDKAAAPEVSTERLVNCLLEAEGEDAKSPVPVYQRPGLTAVGSDLDGTSRGSFVFQGNSHLVMGNRVYRVEDDESVTVLSGSVPGYRPVTGGPHETAVFLVSEPAAYRFDGAQVVPISDPDLPAVVAGTMAKGWGVASRQGFEGQFYITRNRNLLEVDALDFASAESSPDSLVRPFWTQNTLLLMGETSIEPWFPSGSGEFPFAPRGDLFIPIGIMSPYAVADQDNTTFLFCNDLTARRLEGFTPRRISSHGQEALFGAQADAGEAEAWAFDFFPSQACAGRPAATAGHKLWMLSFRGLTMAHDAATTAWHEWQTYGRKSFTGRHFVKPPWKPGAATNGRWYCGGVDEPKIYRVDPDANTDDGRPIVRDLISPPIHQFKHELACSELAVDVTTGTVSTGSAEPKMRLRWSHDGGRSWSHWVDRGLGTTGQRNQRVRFPPMGQGPSWVFNLRITDDVNVTVLNADADMELRPQ